MKSVPKGLLAALAGLAVVVALPYILAWEPPGKAGGWAVEGMETADAIVNQPRDAMDRPRQDQCIKSITVETFGEAYPQPETC